MGGRRGVGRPASYPGEHAIAINPDRVGHTYPPYRYEVSREKVREYALATGVKDAVYKADPADVRASDIVAPPTFAACFALGLGVHDDPELGWHWNMVHGGQEFTFHRHVRVGDVLECTPRIEDLRSRGRMEILTVLTSCCHLDTRDPLVEARSTLIFFEQGDR